MNTKQRANARSLVNDVREAYLTRTGDGGTHWVGCHRVHQHCALRLLADTLDTAVREDEQAQSAKVVRTMPLRVPKGAA